MAVDFGVTLGTNKVLDARRRGAPTEAYKQYAARRSDRPSSVTPWRDYGGWKGNPARAGQMTPCWRIRVAKGWIFVIWSKILS